MEVVIVRYNAGNVCSVSHALGRLGVSPIVTGNHELIRKADKVIFPGVGEAGTTMAHLKATGLHLLIPDLKQPVLGICLGMQLMCRHSEEGQAEGLGIFGAEVKRFAPQQHEQKVPHMGWNTLSDTQGALFSPQSQGAFVYFVHSYYVPTGQETVATSHHIVPFSAALQKNNFYATQFHPEKSGPAGEAILKNFLQL